VTLGPVWQFNTPSGTSLPVTLLDFNAGVVNKKVKLSWKTANELNNDRFEIERSKDGVRFDKIGVVAGRGNSTTIQQYTFYDEQPQPGKTFYRLKQVNADSRFKHSNVEWVLFDDLRTFVAYPNPVSGSGSINIYLRNEVRGLLKIKIADMSGREIYAETKNNVQGNFSIRPGLAEGAYTLTLAGNNLHASQKIIVVNK
jgi:hypothetical protein